MAASVSFNGNKITAKLDLLVQVQLPFIASQTVGRLAPIARKDVQREMLDVFDYVNNFTVESPLYGDARNGKSKRPTKKDPSIDIYINWDKGAPKQSPADYLRPQIVGGTVLRTRFQRGLSPGQNGAYHLPIHSSPGAKLNELGRIKASQYSEAANAIGAFNVRTNSKPAKAKRKQYFYVGPSLEKKKRTGKSDWFKGYGIYRIVGKEKHLLFKMLDQTPTVRPKFKFREAVKYSVANNFKKQFELSVAYAMRNP